MGSPSQQLLLDTLTDAVGVGGTLAGAFLGLYTEGPPPGPGVLQASLTEADYTGYARQAVAAYGVPYLQGGNTPRVNAAMLEFRPTGSTITNLIKGWFLSTTDAPGGALLMMEDLDEPVLLAGVLTALPVVAALALDPDGNYGGGVEIP